MSIIVVASTLPESKKCMMPHIGIGVDDVASANCHILFSLVSNLPDKKEIYFMFIPDWVDTTTLQIFFP